MTDFANAMWEVARKEVLQHIRTKRLLIIGGLLAASLVLITLVFGPMISRGFDEEVDGVGGVARENFAMAIYFSAFFVGGYFFIQLLSIVLTADAVCSEWANRTIFLLLSKPVSRTSFVLGKFLGSLATIAGTILVLFSVDYAVMQGLYEGSPTADEVQGFIQAVLVLILGAAAFAAVALFFSTLTRSTVMSLLFTLGAWIIVFPLIAQIGLFTTIGDSDFRGDFDDPRVDWSRYLSPSSCMQVASRFLTEEGGALLGMIGSAPAKTGLALVALTLHIGFWLTLSLLIVQRRNFE
jgi:ABC-type transport system involved in multi-copper enzyme maturation permease subunit